MRSIEWRSCVALAIAGLIAPSTVASAEDISGIISTTRTITQDSRLVGDVTCRVTGAACIAFGAPHLTLRLNGFTMTGQADPVNACSGTITGGEHGISTATQTDATIQGPGTVQRFRATGVFFAATLNGKVEGVTVTTNCQSGIQVNPTSSGISVVGNLTTRNGTTNAGAFCGGIWIQGNNNSVRWNETTGNGYAVPNDDFGIGLFSGNNNLVEENTAVGNTNGIIVFPPATNNRIRGNVVIGNPPIQESVAVPGSTGVDLWDQSPPSANNVFDRNVCITAINAPCPGTSPIAVPRKPGG